MPANLTKPGASTVRSAACAVVTETTARMAARNRRMALPLLLLSGNVSALVHHCHYHLYGMERAEYEANFHISPWAGVVTLSLTTPAHPGQQTKCLGPGWPAQGRPWRIFSARSVSGVTHAAIGHGAARHRAIGHGGFGLLLVLH